MDRLTARSPRNNMAYLVNVKDNEQAVEGSYNTLMCFRDAFERLAEYEETALTPDAIKKLLAVFVVARAIIEACDNHQTWSMESLRIAVAAVGADQSSNHELDWDKAAAWLQEVEQMYTEIGSAGYIALTHFVRPTRDRFNNGERTQELYDAIMELQ